MFTVFLFQACGYFTVDKGGSSKETSETAVEAPFSSKFPDEFSADIEMTALSDGNSVVRKYFVANRGKRMLEKYNVGGSSEFWLLIDEEGDTYRLNPKEKSYQKIETGPFSGRRDPLSKSLAARLIYRRSYKTFEKIGEVKGLQKYKVIAENSKETATYLFVDMKLNLPVRQESYSIKEGKEELVFKSEFKNINTEPTANLFVIPKDFSEAE